MKNETISISLRIKQAILRMAKSLPISGRFPKPQPPIPSNTPFSRHLAFYIFIDFLIFSFVYMSLCCWLHSLTNYRCYCFYRFYHSLFTRNLHTFIVLLILSILSFFINYSKISIFASTRYHPESSHINFVANELLINY